MIPRFRVNEELLDIFREHVADDTVRKAEVFAHEARCGFPICARQRLLPLVNQVPDFGGELGFVESFGGGADNKPAFDIGFNRLRHVAKSIPLTCVFDAARHADIRRIRHVDDVTSGQSDVVRNAGALVTHWLLADLDEDFLLLRDKVAD